MKHSKEFYETAIRVIDSFGDGEWNVHNEQARLIAGKYWREIVSMVKDYTDNGSQGKFSVIQRPSLCVIREDCERMIREINNAEYDRDLANEESIINIKYGRKGYRLSIIALILSGIAILLETAKWIIELFR